MPPYTPLGVDDLRRIASSYYDERKAKSIAQPLPRHVLVGGQPGAGKSAAAILVRAELAGQGGYIHVDADRMREHIPTGASRPTSQETQQDAGRLVTHLRNLATEGKRHILEEGTFRDPSTAGEFIASRHERGYSVELVAVATPREESLLGIYQRFEHQHAAGSLNPRFVDDAYHDAAMQGFEKTLALHAGGLDRVRVIDRDGRTLYDSAAGPGNAMEALAAGQRLSDARLGAVSSAWQAIARAAEQRNAPAAYLDAVHQHQQRIEGMQKGRIHDHAMAQLDRNTHALGADPRFAAHSDGELLKAGYYRGFQEKANEFKGGAPGFSNYDSIAADRGRLAQLPDVAGLDGLTIERDRPAPVRDDGLSL